MVTSHTFYLFFALEFVVLLQEAVETRKLMLAQMHDNILTNELADMQVDGEEDDPEAGQCADPYPMRQVIENKNL